VIAEAPTTPSVGTTFHVVGVFDGADAILYLDGTEVARTALGTATTNTNTLPITLGADSDPTNPRDHIFDGTIDEVAIYDSALPGPQILAHFNAANALLGMTVTDSTANFTSDLVGGTLSNTADGSSCTIAAFTTTTLTCETQLSGGTANTWAFGDTYTAEGPASAYNDPATVFDDEALLVLSEIDPDLNADPTGFDMRDFVPQYRLINGKAYPDTAEIPTVAGNRVLLRYVNAGIQQHTMGILGMNQELIARDASLRPYSQRELAESIGPGRTADAIVTVPSPAPAGGAKYALYDASLLLHNNGDSFGGMLTFLTVSDGPPAVTGPTTSAVNLTPNPANGSVNVTLNTTISGSANITAAEYFIGTQGAAGTGSPMTASDGNFDSPSEGVTATITVATLTSLSSGDHTFYVHGSDGTWGALNFAVLHLDKLGPATSGITLTPNPSNGSVGVAVSATGNDSATGNSIITAAEFFIDATGADGTGTAMTVNVAAPIASLAGTINAATMAGLTQGAHTLYVHSMDNFGQWGDYATATLMVDQSGPDTSNVVADPNPNNGSQPYNPSIAAVRVDATLSDPMTPDVNSTIQRAEGFINVVGADGSGFPLSPSDGLFNESVEDAYVYIPLSTIGTLGVGTHQIYVHAQDASGNWGATDFVDFVIETDIPTVTDVTVTPNTTDGTVLVDLTANASDPSSGIDMAEWFTGADPGTGNGMSMTVTDNGTNWDLAATIDASGWAPGNYQINVRAMDAAGNWSPTASTFLTVTAGPPTAPELLYFSTFGNGLVPVTASPYDDADVYLWDSGLATFSRVFDARAGGANILPTNADIDGLAFDPDAGAGFPLGLYYISFRRSGGTNVPDPAGGTFQVQDEDVVTYDPENGEWQLYFAGVDVCDGMDATNGHNIDAFDVVGGVSYFSTAGNAAIAGAPGPYDDADIYKIDPVLGCIRVLDASTTGLDGTADIDGLTVIDDDTFYISFDLDAGTFVPGLGLVPDESVVLYDAGVWSLYFDGTAQGLGADNNQDLDAIDVQ
jgi:hypothetical protein